jgi:integrase
MELFGKKGHTANDLKEQNEEALADYKDCREQAEKEYDTGTLKVADFKDITIDWYNDFLNFYYQRGCGANYIGKHIKNLKTIMRQAREEGLHNNTEIERRSFKALSEPSESIYLTEKEVAAMYAKDLSDNAVYAKVRDVFLCGVYTAQRYSDYSRINKDMIKEEDGVRYIELIQQKTGEKCLIPMRPELETILSRYDYTLPKTFEQKINFNIKEVGKLCDIKEGILTETFRSGMKVKKTTPKYKLIKTHTARRTGCTLMYLAGVQPIDIMKVSGHKTEKEFLKYIKVGKKETAMNLARHPYFIGNPLSVAK